MSELVHIQHYRSAAPTSTESAIWERRQRFRNSLSSRAVLDEGIDLKREKKCPPLLPVLKKHDIPDDVKNAVLEGDFIGKLVSDFEILTQPDIAMIKRSDYTIKEIQIAICRVANMSYVDLISPRRPSHLTRPRQLAMALCKAITLRNLPEIGRRFSRDHTTVLHSVRKMQPVIDDISDIITVAPIEYIVMVAIKSMDDLIQKPKHYDPNRYMVR